MSIQLEKKFVYGLRSNPSGLAARGCLVTFVGLQTYECCVISDGRRCMRPCIENND